MYAPMNAKRPREKNVRVRGEVRVGRNERKIFQPPWPNEHEIHRTLKPKWDIKMATILNAGGVCHGCIENVRMHSFASMHDVEIYSGRVSR